ncbi:zinc-ribbon domain-containing protein [Psychromonas hadalis]|uniref:YfgJ family double zinc ribbon protein n=1 Tax=Psychromonas hadalis TaxID=211669 RepID=UPI0003B6B6A4|nr:zinc-ribbon domain-containing protein [Psychromonas hadalis]
MDKLECKTCAGKLTKIGKVNLYCPTCEVHYGVKSNCKVCADELERLVACGAVDFWCNQCNELKSKSSANYQLIPSTDYQITEEK